MSANELSNTAQFPAIASEQKIVLLSNQGCIEQNFQNDCHETKTKVQFFVLHCRIAI